MKSQIKEALYADRRILIVAAVWYAIFVALLISVGVNPFGYESYLLNAAVYGSVAVIYIFFKNVPMLVRERPDSPISAIVDSDFNSDRMKMLERGIPVLAAMIIFMSCFSTIKAAIPLFNDYRWDGYWTQLDYSIHGNHPWKILQPLLGFPIISSALSLFYHSWIALIYAGGLYFCFFQTNRQLRERYLITFFSCWAICGVILAIIFSSVGPVFLEPIFGDHTFSSLMTYLKEANQHFPVLTLGVQDTLLIWHQYGEKGLGRGITAMPSMHVSLALLFFLAMRHISRIAALAFGIFFVIILIGSVHLAYHYAVDGYVSIIVTAIIWKLAGWWAGRSYDVAEGVIQPDKMCNNILRHFHQPGDIRR